MSTRKCNKFIAVAWALALIVAAAAPSQAAQTSCGQGCSAVSSDDRGTRAGSAVVAWAGGGVGTMRSGR